jgi:ankyrin repeat protein
MRTLLQWEADPEMPDRDLCRPIHKAVADGDDECVRILLEAGASPKVADIDGGQPIHNVFFSPGNRVETIRLLLAHGADINARSKWNFTPLHWAVACPDTPGAMENIKYIIENGVDIDAHDSLGNAAIFRAVRYNDLRLIRWLIDRGARLDGKGNLGTNLLHTAAWNGSAECWKILTEAARNGGFANIDLKARHEKHDLWYCLGECRDKWCVVERESKEAEKAAFQTLIQAIEGDAQVEVASNITVFSLRGEHEKIAEIVVEQIEMVGTDDESVYEDAREIICC